MSPLFCCNECKNSLLGAHEAGGIVHAASTALKLSLLQQGNDIHHHYQHQHVEQSEDNNTMRIKHHASTGISSSFIINRGSKLLGSPAGSTPCSSPCCPGCVHDVFVLASINPPLFAMKHGRSGSINSPCRPGCTRQWPLLPWMRSSVARGRLTSVSSPCCPGCASWHPPAPCGTGTAHSGSSRTRWASRPCTPSDPCLASAQRQ